MLPVWSCWRNRGLAHYTAPYRSDVRRRAYRRLGSQAAGTARRDSDIDVAAFFAEPAPASFEVDVPSEVDLVVLNQAPLEIAGRIAMNGALLFDDNPAARIR